MNLDIVQGSTQNRNVAHGETIPRWSRASRLALGGWTFSMPLAAVVIAAWAVATEPDVPSALFGATYGLFVMHFILLLFYVSFAAQNPRLGRARLPWLLSLLFAGPVAILAYWVIHVWNAPSVGRSDVDHETPGYDEADARDEAMARAVRVV